MQILMGIMLLLLVIASFYDLALSELLYNRTSLFAKTVHVFAQLPTYILMAFFSAGVFNTRKRDGSANSMASAFGGFLLTAGFGFLCGYVFLFNLNLYSMTLTMAIAIGIFVCCYIITKLICDDDAKQLRKISFAGLISFGFAYLIGMVMILLLERMPFGRLDASINVFEAWYRLRFHPDQFGVLTRCFPSLNTLIASSVLMMNLFSVSFKRFSESEIMVKIATYSWLFVVALSQVVLGYAYVSDVVISILINMVMMELCLFGMSAYYEKKEKKFQNEKEDI